MKFETFNPDFLSASDPLRSLEATAGNLLNERLSNLFSARAACALYDPLITGYLILFMGGIFGIIT